MLNLKTDICLEGRDVEILGKWYRHLLQWNCRSYSHATREVGQECKRVFKRLRRVNDLREIKELASGLDAPLMFNSQCLHSVSFTHVTIFNKSISSQRLCLIVWWFVRRPDKSHGSTETPCCLKPLCPSWIWESSQCHEQHTHGWHLHHSILMHLVGKGHLTRYCVRTGVSQPAWFPFCLLLTPLHFPVSN